MARIMDELAVSLGNNVEHSKKLTQLMRTPVSLQSKPQSKADWSQAPQGATHSWVSPSGRRVWFKLRNPHDLASLFHAGRWVADVNYCVYWMQHPDAEAKPGDDPFLEHVSNHPERSTRLRRS
jgi:hypothetical protein